MGISIAGRWVRHGRLRKVVMRLRTVIVTVARFAGGTAPDITCHGLIRAGRAAFPPADPEVSRRQLSPPDCFDPAQKRTKDVAPIPANTAAAGERPSPPRPRSGCI